MASRVGKPLTVLVGALVLYATLGTAAVPFALVWLFAMARLRHRLPLRCSLALVLVWAVLAPPIAALILLAGFQLFATLGGHPRDADVPRDIAIGIFLALYLGAVPGAVIGGAIAAIRVVTGPLTVPAAVAVCFAAASSIFAAACAIVGTALTVQGVATFTAVVLPTALVLVLLRRPLGFGPLVALPRPAT